MQIIPVIDIYRGKAVHARGGNRDRYQPVDTLLCPEPEVPEVVRAYLSVYPFRTIYLADLNAIKDEGENNAIIQDLLVQFPDLCFWLDAGTREDFFKTDPETLLPVIGSETNISPSQLQNLNSKRKIILSLDFRHGSFLGDQKLLRHTANWPDRVILMSLDKVGSDTGPDIERFTSIHKKFSTGSIYLAGGVRNAEDLALLSDTSVAGVLIASALHNKSLGRDTIENYMSGSSD